MIPSMGGDKIATYLYELADSILKDGDTVVEIGCWLGASTYPVMQAVGKVPGVGYYCYDRWKASRSEVRKAKDFGVLLREGQNLLPMFLNNVAEVAYVQPAVYRTNIKDIRPAMLPTGKVKLMLVDAGKKKTDFDHLMRMFKPLFIESETILVLQDYYYEQAFYQIQYMKEHPGEFEQIKDLRPAVSGAVFRFLTNGSKP